MSLLVQEFKSSIEAIESYYPLVLQMADKDGSPMWEPLKSQDGVNVLYLPVGGKSANAHWADQLPHMVKGVGVYPLSLHALYRFIVQQDFAFRQSLDPLIQVWDTIDFLTESQRNQLYMYYGLFKPPTRFVAPRDFLFASQTYLLDKDGNNIPLPPQDNLEDFIDQNVDKVHRIVILNRSVTEEEIVKSCHKQYAADVKGKVVRGFIRCIATVIDKIDAFHCRSQLLGDMDPGGYIPEWVKGIIATHNANSFIKLKTYLEKHGNIKSVEVK